MSDDYRKYITESFGKWAPFYDLFTRPIFRIRDRVVDMIDEENLRTVLDVCTGTGAQAFAFGERGYKVTGIDLSTDMLQIAKRKNRYPNVQFQVADATNIPFCDNSFDISCISFALHDMPYSIRHKVLDEMNRVSRRLVIVDYYIPQNKLKRWLYVFFTSVYESMYYRDFAKRDINELLCQHNLAVVKEARTFADFAQILVCQKINTKNQERAKRGIDSKLL